MCSHTLTVTNVIMRQLPAERRLASCDVVKLLQVVDANRTEGALRGSAKGGKNANFLEAVPLGQKGKYKNKRNERIAALEEVKGLSRKGKREAKARAAKVQAANDAACRKKSLSDNAKAVKAAAAKPKKTISKEQAPRRIVLSYCIVLYRTVSGTITLYYVVTNRIWMPYGCIVLYRIVSECTVWFGTVSRCIRLYYVVMDRIVMPYGCIVLYHIVSECTVWFRT